MAAKGVKTSVTKKHLRHRQFCDCLHTLSTCDVQQNLLRSKNHTISSITDKKVGLSAFDTKRCIQDDGIHTYAYGYYKTLLIVYKLNIV